jgi:TolB protein
MKILCAFAVLSVSLTCCSYAQQAGDIHATISRQSVEAYKIAVEDFKSDQPPVTPEEADLAVRLAEVIRDDLDFHVAFEDVPMDSSLMLILEIDEMTRLAWKHLGAEYLVTGAYHFAGEEMSVRYTIWNLNNMTQVRSDGFRSNRNNFRGLAHSISDDVVWQIGAFDPIFNTRIVYVSAVSGNKELYVCDYDGADSHPLTSNGSINLSPVWNADGTSIYYTSYKDGTPELFRVDLNRGKHTKVASYKGLNSAPAIAPSNDEICLTLTKDGNAELYLLNMDGGIKHRLTYTSAIESSPSYGPDGQTIAFSSDRTGSPQVYLMDHEGLNVRRVTYEGNYNDSPALSPDGGKIAFVTRKNRGGFDICVVDTDGRNFRVITDTGSNENPHWAPDGYHLVYSQRRGDTYDLYISDFHGITKRKITSDASSTNPDWGPARH